MSKCTYVTEERLLDFAIEASDGLLPNDIYCNTTVGGIKAGTKIAKGTSYGTIFQMLLTTYQAPVLSISLTPSTTLYEKGVDSLTSLKITTTITKKSNPIKSIKWYMGSSELGEYTADNTTGLSSGGTFDYNYSGTISNDVTIKVVVTDSENKTVTKEIPIKFVGMSYYGILEDESIPTPTETDIKALNTKLQDKKEYVYSGITTDYGRIVYAYPKSFGDLTSIKDTVNNINYTNSFTRTEITMSSGLEYYCYTLTDPAGMTNIQMTFA